MYPVESKLLRHIAFPRSLRRLVRRARVIVPNALLELLLVLLLVVALLCRMSDAAPGPRGASPPGPSTNALR